MNMHIFYEYIWKSVYCHCFKNENCKGRKSTGNLKGLRQADEHQRL